MALSRGRSFGSVNYWPGFVDALSTMLLVIIFLLSVFMLAQFFLSREVTGKDTALARLNHQIEELTSLLALERSQKSEDQTQDLDADRDARSVAERAAAPARRGLARRRQRRGGERQGERRGQRARRAAADLRSARWRRSTSSISRSPRCASNWRRSRKRSTPRKPPTRRRRPRSPTSASASTSRWRRRCRNCRAIARISSAACGRFSARGRTSGSSATASCSNPRCCSNPARRTSARQGGSRSTALAAAVLDLEREIPPDIPWILRIDGHTDSKAITGGQFKSNWDLSAARAIAVVQYLVSKGIEPTRLAAAGFGEFQPIDTGNRRGGAGAQPPHRAEADRAVRRCPRACLRSPRAARSDDGLPPPHSAAAHPPSLRPRRARRGAGVGADAARRRSRAWRAARRHDGRLSALHRRARRTALFRPRRRRGCRRSARRSGCASSSSPRAGRT